MLQLELKKSKQDFQKLRGTLHGVLERQRESDKHVENLERSMRRINSRSNLSNNKNISGNLITVYNNAGVNDKEQIKSSGLYHSQQHQLSTEHDNSYIDELNYRFKQDKMRILDSSSCGPYESSDNQENNRRSSRQHFSHGATKMLTVTENLQNLILPSVRR